MEIIKFENFLNESNNFTYTKGCIMLDFNYNKWGDFIKNLINEKDLYDKEGFGFEEEPHVTILFGILPDKHNPEEIKEKLLETDINLHRYYELKYISIFESKDYDVLKFDLKDCDEVFELNKYCVEEFEFENDYPKYNPHVTIAYIKKGRGKRYIQNLIEPLIVQPFGIVYSYPNEDGSENLKDTILEYEPLDENIEVDIEDIEIYEDNLIEDIEINEGVVSDNDWAIFKIVYSEKHFVTKLNGKEGEEYIGTYESSLKYSDPEVLKFSLEDAKNIVNNSLHFGEKIGIVNSKGIQELFTEKIKDEEIIENKENIKESINEIRYRIVSDYGHGDKSYVERMLTKEEVRNWFINKTDFSEKEFDEVGIEHFMDSDFNYYVEIDQEDEDN